MASFLQYIPPSQSSTVEIDQFMDVPSSPSAEGVVPAKLMDKIMDHYYMNSSLPYEDYYPVLSGRNIFSDVDSYVTMQQQERALKIKPRISFSEGSCQDIKGL